MTRSTRAAIVAASAAAGLVLAMAPAVDGPVAAEAQEQQPRSAFTLAVMPDTQFYSRYAESNFVPDYGTDPFAEQTAWIAEHADELNIPFVTHVGDVVDVVSQESGWATADAAMRTLEEADVPYAIVAGNHDVRNSSNAHVDTHYDLADEPFLQHFSAERAAQDPAFGGADATGLNRYHVFEAEGQQYLVLSLNWRVSDETLEWANDVVAAHPGVPTILVSHDIIGIQNDGRTAVTSDNGERLWSRLIERNDQIFLTLNGHFHGSTHLVRQNAAGNDVTQILIDHQMAYEGGNGYLGLLEFDITGGSINLSTVSPWVVSKPHDRLTSYDSPVLTDDTAQYSVALDFETRFEQFATVAPSQPDLSARAIDVIMAGFPGVPENQQTEAGSAADYVRVDGTLAHWQLTGEPGVVDEGQVFEDLAGENDLRRVSLAESGSPTAELGDVTVEDAGHRYAPSQQAVCFADSDRSQQRFSYLSTASEAAVNDADLSNGYTVETMVFVAEEWTAAANEWSKVLVRTGNRSEIEGMPWSQWDYTASPAALGMSNLREFQWTEVGADAARGDKTNWSGEILPGTWNHVAVVNDAAEQETVMYVNGAPVLRTAQETSGMAFNEGMPWILGADWVDDAASNGWHGCVGETRIVDRPIGQEDWLTARPDLESLTVSADVEGETVLLTGDGAPGATVTAESFGDAAAVAEDGTWSLELASEGLSADASGVAALQLRQGFGERVSEPIEVTVTLPDAEPAPSEPTDPADPAPSAPGEPTEPAPGGEAVDPEADDAADLPKTGVSLQVLALIAGLLLAVAGAALAMRRRRAARV